MLKSQDLLVLLKLCVSPELVGNYASLAEQLGLSVGEAHNCIKRSVFNGLAQVDAGKAGTVFMPSRRGVLEFCSHGARYAFAAQLGPEGRGMPTSFGVEPLASQISSKEGDVPVWPMAKGNVRGPTIVPLYPSAPLAAQKDARLYTALALLDAIRTGRNRERSLAVQELAGLLERAHAAVE